MTSHDIPFPDITDWVRDHADRGRSRCCCGRDLLGDQVLGYPHDAGWFTDEGKMWLFVHCLECGYEMALWKMGISRNHDFRTARNFSESDLCDLARAAPDPAGIRVISARGKSV